MALRLVEAFVPEEHREETLALLSDAAPPEHVWAESSSPEVAIVRAVVGSSRTGDLIDQLHERFSSLPAFRVLVVSIDAVLPRPAASGEEQERAQRGSSAAVSREEVYAKVADGAELNRTFLSMTVLATIVAAIGMAKSNEAAVIGAMVVAPLLGPNMGLALGLTLADGSLIRSALKSNLAGFALAFFTAVLLGVGLDVDPSIPEISSRTRLGFADLLLALAAGCAGTLAYTTGAPSYLIGVMVAVAILPPTVASALLLGDGHMPEALQALLLVTANVAAVNLAGMLTFVVKGMRPRTWWRAERAKKSMRVGISVWVSLLAILGVLIAIYTRTQS
ncbi:MAG: TIGR00341 family protein [Myxococcales bacterium]|nr:TIGR00341 family protein [Myxococcales bacterium]